MRRGMFFGGSCSGLPYESIDNAQIVLVVNRSTYTYEEYEWEVDEDGERWRLVDEAKPFDDRLNEPAGDVRTEQIPHPDPSWVPPEED